MSTLLAAALATLVFCAPGYPGGAGDAQPLVDQFASAATAAAGWPAGSLAAVYDPTEDGGLAKIKQADAVLAFVPYPFLVEHGAELHLTPLVQADVSDVGLQQRWTLVAKSGRITGAASMAGYTVLSAAGYAPEFVRHSALAGWALPPDAKIEATGQILSALRRAAAGEPVAVIARSDASRGASKPAVRQRTQDRDAVCGAARRRHRGNRHAGTRGTCQGLAGGIAEDGPGGGRHRLIGTPAFARLRTAQAAVPRSRAVTKGFLCCGLATLAVAGCATRPQPPAPAPSAEPASTALLAAAIHADSERSDHESDSKVRGELAAEAEPRRPSLPGA
jgi:hypothetical protein